LLARALAYGDVQERQDGAGRPRGGRRSDIAACRGLSDRGDAVSESTDHPWPARSRRLRVGELQVDLRYRQLLGPAGEVELPQRVFELLLLFLAEPHVLHSRAALFERVWPAVVVEDANLSQSIWMLRKALGPDRKQWIRTASGTGDAFEPP